MNIEMPEYIRISEYLNKESRLGITRLSELRDFDHPALGVH